MGKGGSPVLLALALLIVGGNCLSLANDNDTALEPKQQDMILKYRTSIRYWDTNDESIKKNILKDLTASEDIRFPGCPRIRYPLVCDSDGNISENSCYFRMKRREQSNLVPIMIFTVTPIENARNMCENEVKNANP